MNIKLSMSIGYINTRTEIVEYGDNIISKEDWNEMSEEQKDDFMKAEIKNFMDNYFEVWWEEIE